MGDLASHPAALGGDASRMRTHAGVVAYESDAQFVRRLEGLLILYGAIVQVQGQYKWGSTLFIVRLAFLLILMLYLGGLTLRQSTHSCPLGGNEPADLLVLMLDSCNWGNTAGDS